MLYPQTSETRDLFSLDGIWLVHYDFEDSGEVDSMVSSIPSDCDEVAVPASLNEQTTDRNKYLHMGTVWHYKKFRWPVSWKDKRVCLRFGSVNYRAEVYLDGQHLGGHETGYTPFEFELPSSLIGGSEHLLCVKVDNKLSIETVPQGNVPASAGGVAGWRVGNMPNVHYDFFPFTGIHRPVTLVATQKTKLQKTHWLTDTISDSKTKGSADFKVDGSVDRLEVKIEELDFVAQVQVDKNGYGKLDFDLTGVQPWGLSSPKLYRIDLRIFQGDELVDHYPLDFGFRTIAVQGEKFLLNNEPIFMRGFGRHEDLAVIGKGLNLPFLVKDFNLMHWIGANSFRTSHYPYSEEQLDMADRQGILVISETAANTISMCAVKGDPEAKARLLALHKEHSKEMIERDFNHPCVVAWSLGNECEMWRELSQGYFNDLMRASKPLDRSRPFTCVSMAADRIEGIPDIEADEFDFIGYNAYPGWYFEQGRIENIKPWLEPQIKKIWESFGKPILLSEFGADTLPGLHDEYCLMWTEEYQVELLREMLEFAESTSCCMGAHIWNFADFKVGQHTGRIVLNWKGIFTRDRHPKAAAHAVRAMWTGETSTMPRVSVGGKKISSSGARYT